MTEKERSSGILLAISSLPSPHGIGTMGKAAYEYVDFLHNAGQSYWQILPVGPVSYGDSPYQSFSSFAGNPYYIDLDMLISDGLLTEEEVNSVNWGDSETSVDYGKLYENRFVVLKKAYERGFLRDKEKIDAFCEEKKNWLYNYALFMALKRHFDMKPWSMWPMDIRLHENNAVEKYMSMLSEEVNFFIYIQYLFFSQWKSLKKYADENNIKIIGDVPIYVAYDSADCWAEPNWFFLDEENTPVEVSGVPPDYFNENGQLWGNPLYRWDDMKNDGYGWWIRRLGGAFELFDIVRFDHFRGIESFWAVPFGEKTARKGKWVKGPGLDFINAMKNWFYGKQFIAEDLGILTDDVIDMLNDSGLPGMKVMEFSLDEGNPAGLPYNFGYNTICYTGTHDNSPVLGWIKDVKSEDEPETGLTHFEFAQKYLGLNESEGYAYGMIRGGMSSPCKIFIAQMQDYLELDEKSRMNTPGNPDGNWKWRLKKGEITPDLSKRILETTKCFGRASV